MYNGAVGTSDVDIGSRVSWTGSGPAMWLIIAPAWTLPPLALSKQTLQAYPHS